MGCSLDLAVRQHARNPRCGPDDPFFQDAFGNALSRSTVTAFLRQAATSLGRDPIQYTLHSPRIGAVNALLLHGYDFPFTKIVGHWLSDAIFDYVRIQLAAIHRVRVLDPSPRRAQLDLYMCGTRPHVPTFPQTLPRERRAKVLFRFEFFLTIFVVGRDGSLGSEAGSLGSEAKARLRDPMTELRLVYEIRCQS